ncbi:putative inner membrane protein [Salmonella enterica subsp. enterica serovar Typhimurium]|nr:putative inner membrane protein [Salmonella enterica subsp. enterica]VFS22213.1 putative inner membrane protein [Salmonella enterica subsp. enterica serovar Typhimurium]
MPLKTILILWFLVLLICLLFYIPFLLQVAYVLATDYPAIHGPRPDGPLLTPVTSLSMLLGTHSLAAFKQLELFWLYIPL